MAIVGALAVAAVLGLVIWSQVGVMAAEPEPLAGVRADASIAITDGAGAIVLAPTTAASTRGVVFIPGAKVDPWAYAAKLAPLVTEEGATVVITRPWFNLAFFDPRPLSAFTDLAPEVGSWAVGGHSLGGVRACQLATNAQGLVLFAAYCANDLSGSGLPVLSLSGSEDAISTAEEITGARANLPPGAELVEIPGAAHSSFGDYGLQPGDGTATIDDAATAEALAASLAPFLAALP